MSILVSLLISRINNASKGVGVVAGASIVMRTEQRDPSRESPGLIEILCHCLHYIRIHAYTCTACAHTRDLNYPIGGAYALHCPRGTRVRAASRSWNAHTRCIALLQRAYALRRPLITSLRDGYCPENTRVRASHHADRSCSPPWSRAYALRPSTRTIMIRVSRTQIA